MTSFPSEETWMESNNIINILFSAQWRNERRFFFFFGGGGGAMTKNIYFAVSMVDIILRMD